MSIYTDYRGTINFPDEDEFKGFITVLKEGKWIEGDKFLDEMNKVDEGVGSIDYDKRTIELHGTFRNLHRVIQFLKTSNEIDPLFKKEGLRVFNWEGKIISTCEDGCFEGEVMTPEKCDFFCLYEYGQKIGFTDYTEDNNEDWEMRCEIMTRFHEDPYWKPNSVDFITEE